MTGARHVLIGTASALALAALPVNLQSLLSGTLEPAAALAKSDHSGGNGDGGGHGGGNGGGHGHSGEHGKSGIQGGSEITGGGSTHPGGPKLIIGEETHGQKGKHATASKLASGKSAKKKADEIETAALPEDETAVAPKEKNFKAYLAGLNSLNRNFRAYLNSQDPRMAKIRDFVLASAHLEIDQDNFDKALKDANLTAFDNSTIYDDDPTLKELEDRQAYLETQDQTNPAVQQEEAALGALLDSEQADALRDAQLAGGTDDAALKEALLAAANDNRIAQYGEDNYINDDVMAWAKDLLGVGAATGKIDEVRQTLEK